MILMILFIVNFVVIQKIIKISFIISVVCLENIRCLFLQYFFIFIIGLSLDLDLLIF